MANQDPRIRRDPPCCSTTLSSAAPSTGSAWVRKSHLVGLPLSAGALLFLLLLSIQVFRDVMLCPEMCMRYRQRHCYRSNLAFVSIHLYYCVISFPFLSVFTMPSLPIFFMVCLFVFFIFFLHGPLLQFLYTSVCHIRETLRLGLRTTEEP